MSIIEIMITATCTGIGTATGLTIFEMFIKPRVKRLKNYTPYTIKYLRGKK